MTKVNLITIEECREALDGRSICLAEREFGEPDKETGLSYSETVRIYYFPGESRYEVYRNRVLVDGTFSELRHAVSLANKLIGAVQE